MAIMAYTWRGARPRRPAQCIGNAPDARSRTRVRPHVGHGAARDPIPSDLARARAAMLNLNDFLVWFDSHMPPLIADRAAIGARNNA